MFDADIADDRSSVVSLYGVCAWQGTPAVMETYIDSKKEVDSHLKKTCEEFIHSITQMFIGPLADFLTKVDIVLCLLH